MTSIATKKINIGFDVFVAIWNLLYRQKTPQVHLKIIRWLERSWREKNTHLLLMAFRACGKSTLIGLFVAWLLMQDPDLRIIVLAADLNLSRKMVRNVKKIIERHPLVKHLKPSNPDQWAADMLTVLRDKDGRDPSVLARSVTANMTGSRADVIICDDVEVPATCETAEKRQNLRQFLAEIDYVLVPGGTQLYVGTPHHYFSIYAENPAKELNEKQSFLSGFDRLVLPILDDKGQSAWPERFTLKLIEDIKQRTGPNKFTSQMMLQPVNINEGRLNPDYIRVYQDDLSYRESNGQPCLYIKDKKLISASCWWDPAFRSSSKKGDCSVVAAVFTDHEGHKWLHAIQYINTQEQDDEDEATQQCRQVALFIKKFHLPAITVEINGIGRFLPGLLRKVLKQWNIGASVKEVSNTRPKSIRIMEAFDAILAARIFNAHQQVWQTPFIREMRDWRPGLNGIGIDDGLDAVAGALLIEPVFVSTGSSYGPSRDRNDWQRGSQSYQIDDSFDF